MEKCFPPPDLCLPWTIHYLFPSATSGSENNMAKQMATLSALHLKNVGASN